MRVSRLFCVISASATLKRSLLVAALVGFIATALPAAAWNGCGGSVWGGGSCGSPSDDRPSRESDGPSNTGPSLPDTFWSDLWGRLFPHPKAGAKSLFYRHVVADGNGSWVPEDGYDWLNNAAGDFRTKWVPGRRSSKYPHIISDTVEGKWIADDGYVWANNREGDFTVRWVANKPSYRWPHVVSGTLEGTWYPEDGYRWLANRPTLDDMRVEWVPGLLSSTRQERAEMLAKARIIANAIAAGRKPPFEAVWDYYGYNFRHHIGRNLVPGHNACAITLSLTLGIRPGPSELNLSSLGHNARSLGHHLADLLNHRDGQSLKVVTDAEIARRYYINAQELAARLGREWGPTVALDGSDAKAYLSGKKGIIFIWHGYRSASHLGMRTGNHIDVWNVDRLGSDATLPLEKAEKVWFWELPSDRNSIW